MECLDIIFIYEHTNNPQKVILYMNTYQNVHGLSCSWPLIFPSEWSCSEIIHRGTALLPVAEALSN